MRVPLDRLLFAVHDMNWEHVDRWLRTRVWPPIEVEPLADGWYFIHDGRHRATAAYESGATDIDTQPDKWCVRG